MAKWRLIYLAFPYAFSILVLKLTVAHLLGFSGVLHLSEIQLIFTAGVFLIGFMLAGTMADYKESERIPGEIAITLEAIEELAVNIAIKTRIDQQLIRSEVMCMSQSIYDWLFKRKSTAEVHQDISCFQDTLQSLDHAGGAPPLLGAAVYGSTRYSAGHHPYFRHFSYRLFTHRLCFAGVTGSNCKRASADHGI
ncbi:MAG: hypothetical protein HC880_01115 [Bacteroidia bacterium]|nr:hypothetical protein [Bacteroidia bacterium]